MDPLIFKLESDLRFKVSESAVRYYGNYVLFDILLEYRWENDWRFLVKRTIKLNMTEQMIIQEQIILDQLKAIQMPRYDEEASAANFPGQDTPTHPTDYFEAAHSIVQKRARTYFETVILTTYYHQIEDNHSLENLRKGLKAVLNATEKSNCFGR